MVNKRPKTKTRKCISLDRDLWASIDIQARERRKSRSGFINEILKTVIGSTKSFLEYELLKLARKFNYAKFQAENFNDEKDIKSIMEKLKAGR